MPSLALISNHMLFKQHFITILEKQFDVIDFNVFLAFEVWLKTESVGDIDIILYIIPEHFNEDDHFFNYINSKDRSKVYILGNNDDQELKSFVEAYHLEGYATFADEQVNLIEELLALIGRNHKPVRVPEKGNFEFNLTAKQKIYLKWKSKGKSKQQIASYMNLSTRQIERIKRDAYSKIGAKSDFQAGIIARTLKVL